MKRLSPVLFFILILISSANAQELKKGYRYLEKDRNHNAKFHFRLVEPKNAASEYGIAVAEYIDFQHFNAKYRKNSISDGGLINLVDAFNHIIQADSLLPFKDKKLLSKIEGQYSNKKVKELKKEILDQCYKFENIRFIVLYNKLEKEYLDKFKREKDFYAKMKKRMYNINVIKEFNVLKKSIISYSSSKKRQKLKTFIKNNKKWKNISQAIDLDDSLDVNVLFTNDERLNYLRKNPNSKYYNKVKSDYIKNLKEEKTKGFKY